MVYCKEIIVKKFYFVRPSSSSLQFPYIFVITFSSSIFWVSSNERALYHAIIPTLKSRCPQNNKPSSLSNNRGLLFQECCNPWPFILLHFHLFDVFSTSNVQTLEEESQQLSRESVPSRAVTTCLAEIKLVDFLSQNLCVCVCVCVCVGGWVDRG